jgi:hypothetical protein
MPPLVTAEADADTGHVARVLLALGLLILAGYLVVKWLPGGRATLQFYLHRGALRELVARAEQGQELPTGDFYDTATVEAVSSVRPIGPDNPLDVLQVLLEADVYEPRLVYAPSRDLGSCAACSFDGRVLRDLDGGWYVCEARRP